jgi:ArsR family transcriptional regulator
MESMVKCLRALGDENRLRILMLLRERDLCVLEVVGALGISQPLASSHLAVLREAGLATARREGRRIRYSLSEEAERGGKHRLLKQVAAAIAAEPLIAADRERLAECAAFRGEEGACTKETLSRFRRVRAREGNPLDPPLAKGDRGGFNARSPGDRAGRLKETFKSTRRAS